MLFFLQSTWSVLEQKCYYPVCGTLLHSHWCSAHLEIHLMFFCKLFKNEYSGLVALFFFVSSSFKTYSVFFSFTMVHALSRKANYSQLNCCFAPTVTLYWCGCSAIFFNLIFSQGKVENTGFLLTQCNRIALKRRSSCCSSSFSRYKPGPFA